MFGRGRFCTAFAVIMFMGCVNHGTNGEKSVKTENLDRVKNVDAIIVEASPEIKLKKGRGGRQFGGVSVEVNHYHQYLVPSRPHLYPESPVVDYEEEEEYHKNQLPVLVPEEEIPGSSCVTKNGEGVEGTCISLKQCYPFMIGNDLDNDGVYEGNQELANMLKSSAGSCSSQVKSRKSKVYSKLLNEDTVGIEVPQSTSDVVCCAGNLTTDPSLSINLKTVGGVQARRNEFPFMVALMNNGRQFCGGTLLNQNHVLTAAHCVAHMNGNDISRMYINLGDYDIYSTKDGYHEWRRVSRVIKHAGFNSRTLYNDIAILKLAYAVPYNSHIQPVTLSGFVSNGYATVAGWGKLGEFGGIPSVLNKANVAPISNQRCQQLYGSLALGGIPSSAICTDGTRTDACSGDSGGPLLQSGRQIGIVSWGIGCARFPGVYTRIGSFMSWIQKNQLG